jgi:hypothetical protein
MSEAKATKSLKPAEPAAPARQRQTIKLNESTNEATPRKGIKRRTDIGDAPATPAPLTEQAAG